MNGSYGFKNIIICFLFLFLVFSQSSCQLKKQHFIVGRDPVWEALPLADPVELIAFTNEVINQAQKEGHLLIAIENCSPISLLSYLDEDKVKGILVNVSPETINSDKYSLSYPLIKTGPVLVVAASSSYTSEKDLKGKFIGVYVGDNSVEVLKNNAGYIIGVYQDPIEAVSGLQSGFYDAILLPAIKAYSFSDSFFKNEIKILTPPLDDSAIYLMVKNGDAYELLKTVNKVCGHHGDSAFLNMLRKKYRLAA